VTARPASGPGAQAVQLTERDHRVLSFAAEHRLVLSTQVQALLGASPLATNRRLRGLAGDCFLTHRKIFHRQPACCQITRKGLAALASPLPPPRLDLACYRHDVGAAWLWLAAHRGAFGTTREVLGERRMRSGDRSLGWPGEPAGVRLGGYGRDGRERLHYPDLVLVAPDGRRTALELELTPKGAARRELILGGYGADSRIDQVLYLVESNPAGRAIARSVADAARGVGVEDRLRVQYIRPLAVIPGDARTGARAHARQPPAGAHRPAASELGR
jgi:hypothetical protein